MISFNTSHVAIYLIYICCSCVVDISFNTSHVAIYLCQDNPKGTYILGFNTSHVAIYPLPLRQIFSRILVSIHLMLLFIETKIYIWREKGGFNTSHVAIYPTLTYNTLHCIPSFNTSHVAIYQDSENKSQLCIQVSIHLMLLFIGTKSNRKNKDSEVSIHLMLLFIKYNRLLCVQKMPFQYISCCYLSATKPMGKDEWY